MKKTLKNTSDALECGVALTLASALQSAAHVAMLFLTLATATSVEIEGLPQPAGQRPAKLVAPQEKTLANGLRVIVVERPGVPLLSAELIVRSGSETDPEKLAGLAKFTASLLTQGTAKRTAPQIASEVESLGASLGADAGWDSIHLALKTLSPNADAAFAILADVARHPQFAPAEIERHRRQALDDLRVEMEMPGQVARLVAARALLGPSPYAHPAEGTLASLPRIKRADIAALHGRAFVPGNAVLVLAGNVTAADGFTLAEKVFGDWPSAKTPAPFSAKTGAQKPRAILVDLPHAGQAAVYVGAPGLGKTDAAFTLAEVTNAVLGTGYSSRLNQEIRLKRGLSYGATSRLIPSSEFGLFAASCQTKNESAAEVAGLIRAELKRLSTEPIAADYFASRKAVLTGNFARELETNDGYVARVADLALHGLPLDTLAKRIARIESVSEEEVRAFAEKHLSPEAMTIVVVGRAKEVAKGLRAIFPKLEVIPQGELNLDAAIGAKK